MVLYSFGVCFVKGRIVQPSKYAGLAAVHIIDVFHTCFIDVLQGRHQRVAQDQQERTAAAPGMSTVHHVPEMSL